VPAATESNPLSASLKISLQLKHNGAELWCLNTVHMDPEEDPDQREKLAELPYLKNYCTICQLLFWKYNALFHCHLGPDILYFTSCTTFMYNELVVQILAQFATLGRIGITLDKNG
jgi:hypothetical protein